MITVDFKECAACAAKPGSPTLCPSCLHNRTTIDRLTAAGRSLLEAVYIGDGVILCPPALEEPIRAIVKAMTRET